MIKINLLPEELSKEEAKGDLVVIGVVLGVIAALSIAGIYAYMFFTEKQLDAKLADARQTLSKYKDIAAQVERLQSDKSRLETRKTVIEGLIKNRLLYSVFMYDFVSVLPDKIWVQNLTTKTQDDNSIMIDIAAKTFSTTFIADWITSLESFSGFTFQDLGAITTAKQPDGSRIFSFTMKIRYRKV